MDNKDKLQQQTHQIFNIAEKPIMEFISVFLEENPSIIFKEEIPNTSDPLILLPIKEYKKNIYLKFTLKTCYPNDTLDDSHRIANINDIVTHEYIKESIGFLLYCIKSVYPSIIASSMINNKPMINVDLELNEDNWTFYPKFQHELLIKKKFLEDALSKIMAIKQQEHQDQQNPIELDSVEINKEFHKIITSLDITNSEITPEILETEKNINISYKNKPVIGIYVEEVTKNQLPKQKYDPPIQQLPVISSQSYKDPC